MTTDGSYLYLYVSAINGGMFKIGTGFNETIPGKIYLESPVFRNEEVYWVYIKNKLYLRTESMDVGTIAIISPETFKKETDVTIHCPEIFSHPTL